MNLQSPANGNNNAPTRNVRARRAVQDSFSPRYPVGLTSILTVALVSVLALVVPLVKIAVNVFSSSEIVSSEDDSSFRSLTSDMAFGKLPPQSRTELAAKVNYLADVIRKNHKAEVDSKQLALHIVNESRRANYDPFFVASLIWSESNFRNQVRSNKGAVGLMQIKPSTGKYVSQKSQVNWHGEDRLTDPAYNIKLGLAYLKYLGKMFSGNVHNTLVAYNWGPGNLKGALRDSSRQIPTGSLSYSRKIQSRYAMLQRDFRTKMPKYQYMSLDVVRG